jgi:hypothetical protein
LDLILPLKSCEKRRKRKIRQPAVASGHLPNQSSSGILPKWNWAIVEVLFPFVLPLQDYVIPLLLVRRKQETGMRARVRKQNLVDKDKLFMYTVL